MSLRLARYLPLKHSINGRQRGFTILEVLIALSIAVLSSLVVSSAAGSIVNQFQSIQLKTYASWIAENKLADLRLGKSMPPAKEFKEDVGFANFEWQLITRVSTTDNPDINRVEVDVLYTHDNGERSKKHTLTGFVGRY